MPKRSDRHAMPVGAARARTGKEGRRLRFQRALTAICAVALASAFWTPPLTAAASPPSAPVHHARLGPLAQSALSAAAHGRHLPTAWVKGRATKRGTTYGVFLRGATTATAITATGATPGTVLSVGATADATLGQLALLAALPGITEVELAGQATRQLDVSVPEIHAAEPGHASTAGVPHLWSGTGGSDGPYVSTQGGKVMWQNGGGGAQCCSHPVRLPVIHGGVLYTRNSDRGNQTLNATNGALSGTFTSSVAPAFDSNEMFTVSGGVLTATGSNNWTYSGDGTQNGEPVTAPIVVNGTVYVGAASGEVYALPEAFNGVNAPVWAENAGAAILPPVEDVMGFDFSPMAGGLAVGGGMLIVPASGTLTAFGDTTVTHSPDAVTAYQIDQAHDGDQPNDSLTAPLAPAPKWSVTLGATLSDPMIANGLVYVIGQAAVVPPQYNGDATLYALHESDGSVAWQVSLANPGMPGLGYDNGRVFTTLMTDNGSQGSEVSAYDAATGALDWTITPFQVDMPAAPVAMNGIVYVNEISGGGPGKTWGFNELTGAVVQSDALFSGDIASPAVTNSGVYVTGDNLATYDFAPSIVSAPAPPTFSGDTGQGTVVGVVDTGIDLANPDFQTNSGTRIADLWDQAACPTNPAASVCPTQPPNSQGFDYGAECNGTAINAGACGPYWYGLAASDSCNTPVAGNGTISLAEMDCDGHGTHVTGIAAGNGRAAPFGTYIGVAPQADLVIVKSDFNLAHIVDGVAYIFKVAASRGEPASVNVSLGTNEGPHDGSDMFETMLDALTGPGKLVTVAGGNESTGSPYYHYHASGTVGNGQVRTDGLVAQSLPVFLDLWYPGADSISASIAETGNGQTPWVAPDTTGVSGEDGTCTQPVPGTDDFTDRQFNTIEILSCTHMPNNGMNEIQIAMFNGDNSLESLASPVDGQLCSEANDCFDEFKLLLHGNSAPTGQYNSWTFDQADYFFYAGDGNDNSTLNEPASAHDVISVGSDVSRNSWPSEAGNETESATTGAISDFSGHGPTLDGRNGIDIVAPGEEIGSSLSANAGPITTDCPAGTTHGCTSPDGNHMFLQGTSMASPHVAGALALLLEQVPTIDVAQAKSLLAQSADTTPLTTGGAVTTWGSGKLRLGPGILTVTPASGPLAGGATIHITGVDLQAGMSMSLGGVPLGLTSNGTNAFSATVPASTEPGAMSLTMRNPDGSTAVDPSAYTYLDPTGYHSLTPFRTCDTRSASTIPVTQCKGKTLGAGGRVTVQITGGVVPAGARSVVVNLTAINNNAGGTYVTAYPAGHALPRASNINLAGAGVATNLAIVQLSAGGAITLYNALGHVDVIVDVEGYFATPTGSGIVPGEFHSIPPLRICDTRAAQATECAGARSNPLAGGTWRDVVLSGLPSGAPGGTPSIPADGTAAAAVFNLTATGGTEGTYLAVAPPSSSDQCPSRPLASNVNPAAGTTLPNRVISPLGPRHDVCVFNAVGSIAFIIDVDGWFGTGAEASTGALFNSIAPTRICDTRSATRTNCSGRALGANAALTVATAGVGEVPDMGGTPPVAVVANLTAVAGSASTFFTLYPSDVVSRPRASDLNPVAGETIANLSIVGIAQTGVRSGDVSLYNAVGSINAILDVAGWFQ
ncbi:MAG: S8 family serine peptidase [Candidatus Dormiibacterota bacterium]